MTTLNLQKSVQIFSSEIMLSVDRIQLSTGVVKANEVTQINLRYCSNAYIPENIWREPTVLEYNSLLSDVPTIPTGQLIGLFRIPDDVITPLEKLGLWSREISEVNTDKQYYHAASTIVDFLKPFCLSTDGLVVHSIVSNPAGLQTVTFSEEQNCYIGLHLDSWDKLPLTQTHLARNRICINLGRESRYFVFFNLTLVDMLEALNISDDKLQQFKNQLGVERKVAYEFMKRYPSYPVVKLCVRPKEAYIAPTENIFHDGCTIGQKYLDLHLTLRGHFQMPLNF